MRNILGLSAIMALGNLEPNISWHSVTVRISLVLINFIKNRLTEKSSDLRLVLFKGQASTSFSRIGRQLDLINCNVGLYVHNKTYVHYTFVAEGPRDALCELRIYRCVNFGS